MSRIALVTGGTRGIGRSISIGLKDAGYRIAANYATNERAAAEFSNETGIPTFKFDIVSYEECERGAAAVRERMGGDIEILINNAGITRDSFMHKMPVEYWHDVIVTNLNSCYNMSKVLLNSMRDKNFGRIVNISSINGQAGQMGQTNYSAAKAGVIGFTKALAKETASKGITVNAIAPGYIKTDMTSAIGEDVLKKIVAAIPVGRMGDPEEVARAVLFLIADEAAFITGETLSINGGQHMD